jgi:hypothetical protein
VALENSIVVPMVDVPIPKRVMNPSLNLGMLRFRSKEVNSDCTISYLFVVVVSATYDVVVEVFVVTAYFLYQ